jgi:hypothetical protein
VTFPFLSSIITICLQPIYIMSFRYYCDILVEWQEQINYIIHDASYHIRIQFYSSQKFGETRKGNIWCNMSSRALLIDFYWSINYVVRAISVKFRCAS